MPLSIADRDLFFQDSQLLVVPGMRHNCLARAGARSVRRYARTKVCGPRRFTPRDAEKERGRSRSSDAARSSQRTRFTRGEAGELTAKTPKRQKRERQIGVRRF